MHVHTMMIKRVIEIKEDVQCTSMMKSVSILF